MREWEETSWAAGRKAVRVIDEVGRAIARRLERLATPCEKILFLAGKGHNGDDARAACRHLGRKRDALLLNIVDPVKGAGQFLKANRGADWIIDGLFGIGLNRPLDADWRKLIQTVNAAGAPILAIDVPSGLNAGTGRVEGEAVVAERTFAIAAPKDGLLKAPKWVGRLEVLTDVGLVACPCSSRLLWTLEDDFAGLPPRRPVESNKGSFGHLAIYAGSLGYHGAAVLAGRGALRARPGLVTVFAQETVYAPIAAQCQAVMVHPWRVRQPPPKNCGAILFGPGMASPALPNSVKKKMLSFWREAPLPVIADASGLDWLRPGPTPPGALRVITPHPGEAGRMLDCSAADVQKNRGRSLRELSERFGGCHVVLKGHQTLVGRSVGPIFVNGSGNPFLAQGGSGDLLGGYLAGLLAQPDWQKDALTAIRYAVWQHGAAADRLSESSANWTVEDLSRHLGEK
jgi:NAD(P)H-hydrate epimerase